MIKNILGKYIELYEDIYLGKEIDNSLIFYAHNKKNNYDCFLKVIDKEKIKSGYYDLILEQLKREEEITKICKSDYIVNLNKKYENEGYIIFEYEYCEKDLEQYLMEEGGCENNVFFKEVILSLGKALKILYEKGIIHRNIMPRNIFIQELENEKKDIKLGNFSYSIFKENNKSEQIGNILYSAPEIIKNLEYDQKCDLWSLGITLYEIYFGELPYYSELAFKDQSSYEYNLQYTNNSIIRDIYNDKKFILKKTKIPTLDILFKRLLVVNPKERMTYDEFFQYIFNDNFMKNDFICINNNIKYKEIYDIILNEPSFGILFQTEACLDVSFEINYDYRKCINFINGYNFPDIIRLSDKYNNIEPNFNNIIYYDENIQYNTNLKLDCKYFEKFTNGAFILCQNLESLNLLKEEILKMIKINKRFIFNLIVTGSKCEKIMKFLQENPEFDKCIKNVCIFCMNKEKYMNLKDKYKKIKGIYTSKSHIINYIKEFSLSEIKPYPQLKLINYEDYINKYIFNHIKISQFYGKKNDSNEIKKEENQIMNKSFYLREDFEYIGKLVIEQYNKNIFYDDLNNIDINIYNNIYKSKYKNINLICEDFSYLTGRIMITLNQYALKNDKFYKENKILYKGDKLYYSSLIKYKNLKGEIILFSSFTSVYEDKNMANSFSGRNESIQQYKNSLKFSVIFIIKNLYKNNWISNLVFDDEETLGYLILSYLPFSFFHFEDIKIDLKNYTADIYLKAIGKVEILEEEIKKGKKIRYNEKENIMEIIK